MCVCASVRECVGRGEGCGLFCISTVLHIAEKGRDEFVLCGRT